MVIQKSPSWDTVVEREKGSQNFLLWKAGVEKKETGRGQKTRGECHTAGQSLTEGDGRQAGGPEACQEASAAVTGGGSGIVDGTAVGLLLPPV